jgi:transcriptional regulator with XRE-family HTH domain
MALHTMECYSSRPFFIMVTRSLMQKKLSHGHSKISRSESPDPIDIHVGSRLKLRRNLIGMSQEQLGRALGLTFQQIQKYERGANRMGASRLHQMSKLLNVSIEWFFDELNGAGAPRFGFSDNKQEPLEGAAATPMPDERILHRRETLDLIRAYYSIADAKKRRKIFELVRSMAEGKE